MWWKNKKIMIPLAAAVILVAVLSVVLLVRDSGEEESVYREASAEYGELTVGLTESGSVTVGTANETFELDLSAFTGDTSFSWGQGGGGGGNLFQGMTAIMGGGSSGSSSSSSSRSLQVEEVLVSEGQELEVGTPIYTLSQESVESIRQELELDVTDAEVALAQNQTQQKMTQLSAQQTYDRAVAYGNLAQTEYDSSITALQTAVDDINEQLIDLTDEINELNLELVDYQNDLITEQKVLENAEYVVSITDIRSDAYGWVTAENAREEAQAVVDSLEETIETTNETIASKLEELVSLQNSLTGAQRDLELGLADAQAQLSLRQHQSSTASEQYQVNVELSDFNVQVAEEEYEDAKAKLDEFNAVLNGQTLTSSYRGVVSEVSLSEGDTVNTGTVLLVINDYDEVTVSVTVEESDLEYISEKDEVNVTIASWPDEEFGGIVDEIGESVYNSSTGISYVEITIKLSGPTEKLYSGMTAEITFITKETAAVLHIPNRAVYREDGKSYVKVKAADGSISAVEVVTGFSDGSEVEIVEGLSEGDVVLIESKVNG